MKVNEYGKIISKNGKQFMKQNTAFWPACTYEIIIYIFW